MEPQFSLVLTKGTHLIEDSTRSTVLAAIESGRKVVEIPVDRFHDGNSTIATIIISHIVALFPISDDQDVEVPLNVFHIARKRG
jgi:hypothetical protein